MCYSKMRMAMLPPASVMGRAVAHSIEYAYRADGLRYSKTVDGVTTYFNYDTEGNVQNEMDAEGEVQRSYLWAGGRALCQYEKQYIPKRYYLYNGHGDVVQVVEMGTDQNRKRVFNVVASYDYDPWGKDIAEAGEDNARFGGDTSIRYAGQMYDEETGLYYLRAR